MISVKNIRGAVQKKEAPQKPRKEDDDCDTCVFVCVHVCVCVCLCEMVTFDDGGGGDGQRRLSQRRRWHQRGPPRLWDCSKISDTPKGVMTVQKSAPPYYALLGC